MQLLKQSLHALNGLFEASLYDNVLSSIPIEKVISVFQDKLNSYGNYKK